MKTKDLTIPFRSKTAARLLRFHLLWFSQNGSSQDLAKSRINLVNRPFSLFCCQWCRKVLGWAISKDPFPSEEMMFLFQEIRSNTKVFFSSQMIKKFLDKIGPILVVMKIHRMLVCSIFNCPAFILRLGLVRCWMNTWGPFGYFLEWCDRCHVSVTHKRFLLLQK